MKIEEREHFGNSDFFKKEKKIEIREHFSKRQDF